MACNYIIMFNIPIILTHQMNKLQLVEIPFSKEDKESNELVTMEPEQLQELDLKQLEYQLTVLQDRLQESKPNLAVIQEYRKKVTAASFNLIWGISFKGILDMFRN